jgi:hypothetical protein
MTRGFFWSDGKSPSDRNPHPFGKEELGFGALGPAGEKVFSNPASCGIGEKMMIPYS